MTRKTIHVLAAVVVGLVLLLVVMRSNDRHGTGIAGEPLLPDFRAVADAVTEVRIARQTGDEGATVQRQDDSWALGERDDYPVDVAKLRQLIIALADAEIVEEKTSNPEQYHRLGVDDPEAGGEGAKVVVTGPDFSYAVILGDTAQGDYRYARIAGNATSYLIDEDPDVPESPSGWLLPDIVDIESSRVRRVAIAHADGETIVIEKATVEQTDFDVLDVPEGRELSYPTVGNGIGSGLSMLELEDVRAHVDAASTTNVEYLTWDGLAVSVDIVSGEEESWISFAAAAQGDVETTSNEADAINARVSGWQYQLADHKKNLLSRRWDDVLKAADESQ